MFSIRYIISVFKADTRRLFSLTDRFPHAASAPPNTRWLLSPLCTSVASSAAPAHRHVHSGSWRSAHNGGRPGTTPHQHGSICLHCAHGLFIWHNHFFVNIFLVAGQVLLLRRRFSLWNLLQIPTVLIFGICIDLAMAIVSPHAPAGWWTGLLMSISGNFVLALGIVMQIRSKPLSSRGRLRTGSRRGHTQVLRFSEDRQRRHTLLDCCRHWICLRGRTHRRT